MLDAPDEVSAESAEAHRKLILWSLDDWRLIQIVRLDGNVHVLQPHAIVRKPDTSEMLEAYQVHGDHEGRSEQGWRHFDLTSIRSVEVLAEKFLPRRDFRPVSGDSGVVVAQVRGSDDAS